MKNVESHEYPKTFIVSRWQLHFNFDISESQRESEEGTTTVYSYKSISVPLPLKQAGVIKRLKDSGVTLSSADLKRLKDKFKTIDAKVVPEIPDSQELMKAAFQVDAINEEYLSKRRWKGKKEITGKEAKK